MSIAITEDHRSLAETVRDFAHKRDARGAARGLLESPTEPLPAFWSELTGLGWLGLHLPEEFGGSGYSLEELVVVVEELGRAVAPGPFVPTVIASAVIDAAADHATKAALLPGLADGSVAGAVALGGDVTVSGGANDVWIFQISGDLDMSAATHVVLSGGAQARNVFWQVAGHSTIHANAQFQGIILCETAITLQTNASMTGRALSQTQVALDNNVITAP